MSKSFEDLELRPELKAMLELHGFKSMTPVQKQTLPRIIEKNSLGICAPTGTGKSLCFLLGLLQRVDPSINHVQSIVLSPTRELALQILEVAKKLSAQIPNLKIQLIYGDQNQHSQLNALKNGVHIIIATPGRLATLFEKERVGFQYLDMLVLDEADVLLDLGFETAMRRVISKMPLKCREKLQVLLISATLNKKIKGLVRNLNIPSDLEFCKVGKPSTDVDLNRSRAAEVFINISNDSDKLKSLRKIAQDHQGLRLMIFCQTKQQVRDLADDLKEEELFGLVVEFQGDLSQKQRMINLAQFENHSARCLVSTDLGARGLDIEDLEVIINYEMPKSEETYVHRRGRTARIGKSGVLYSLIRKYEKSNWSQIIEQAYLPSDIDKNKESYIDSDSIKKVDMRTLVVEFNTKKKIRKSDVLGALVHDVGIKPESIGLMHAFPQMLLVAIKSDIALEKEKKLLRLNIKKRRYISYFANA